MFWLRRGVSVVLIIFLPGDQMNCPGASFRVVVFAVGDVLIFLEWGVGVLLTLVNRPCRCVSLCKDVWETFPSVRCYILYNFHV